MISECKTDGFLSNHSDGHSTEYDTKLDQDFVAPASYHMPIEVVSVCVLVLLFEQRE